MDEPPSPSSNHGGLLPASRVHSNNNTTTTTTTIPSPPTTNNSNNSSLAPRSTTTISSTNNSSGSTGTLHSSDYEDDDEEDDFLFLDLAAYADHSQSSTNTPPTKAEDNEEGPFLALPSFSEQIHLERRREEEAAALPHPKQHNSRSTRMDSSDTAETVESHGSHHRQDDTESTPQQNTSKSALRVSSSYGNIQDAHNNDIPVCTKKSSWKTMPVPQLQDRKQQMGFGSSPSLLQTSLTHATSTDISHSSTNNHNNNTNHTMKNRTVSFSQIHVRDYEITVGDNPGGLQGTPVSLGWQYQQHAAIPVSEYEQHRPQRRSRQELYLPCGARQDMLLHSGGLSRSEVVAAEAAADKIRKQRARTKAWIPLQTLEVLIESATRKAKRMGRIVTHPGSRGKHHHHNNTSNINHVTTKNPSMAYSSSTGCLQSYHQ